MAKVGRKAAIVPLEDQAIIKADIEKGMSYRETIEDVQRKTGHKYWLEKIGEIAKSPTLAGVKPVPNQAFSTAFKPPGSMKFNDIAEPSTYAPSRPLTNNPASDFGYLTGASFLTEDGFNNTNVFEWPIVYPPPILQPSTQDIQPSILDNPFGRLMGKARQLFEQKFDNAMWKAADALTDKWLDNPFGIQQQSSKSDPKVEELIKRAEKLLESSKPPDTTPASVHPDAIAATEKDAKTEFNAPDENTQPSATTKQPKDLQKDELLGKQKINKDDTKEPSDSAQFTKKDAVSNTNQASPPATENISDTADTATELPVDSTKGQPNLNKQLLDEETELKKRTEAPEAPPIVPPATPVEPNPANESGDKQPLTQPPASAAADNAIIPPQPATSSEPIKAATTETGVNQPTEQMNQTPNRIETGFTQKAEGSLWDLLALLCISGLVIGGVTGLELKKAEAEALRLQQFSLGALSDGTPIEFLAAFTKSPPQLYGTSPQPPLRALPLLNARSVPTFVDTSQIASPIASPKSPSTLYGVPLEKERVVF